MCSLYFWVSFLVALLLVGFSLPLLADDFVVLKTGGAFSGTIVEESDEAIVIDTISGRKVVPRKLIKLVVRAKGSEKIIKKVEDPNWGYEFDLPEGWSKKISSLGANILYKGDATISASARFDFFPILESLDRLKEPFLRRENTEVVREEPFFVAGFKAYRIDIQTESIKVRKPSRLYRIILIDVSPIRYSVDLNAPEPEFKRGEAALSEILRSFRINRVRIDEGLLGQKVSARIELIRARKMPLPASLSRRIEDFEAGLINDLSSLMSLDLRLDSFIKQNR